MRLVKLERAWEGAVFVNPEKVIDVTDHCNNSTVWMDGGRSHEVEGTPAEVAKKLEDEIEIHDLDAYYKKTQPIVDKLDEVLVKVKEAEEGSC